VPIMNVWVADRELTCTSNSGITLITEYGGYLVIRLYGGLSGKADSSWELREFIVEVSLPGPTHTLPGHLLI